MRRDFSLAANLNAREDCAEENEQMSVCIQTNDPVRKPRPLSRSHE